MINALKSWRKTLIYLVIIALSCFGGYLSYAQFFADAYIVKTVHIFPAQIEADGWLNVETLSFQNLDEYALLQEFNDINSATLSTSQATFYRLQKKERENQEIKNEQPVEQETEVPIDNETEADATTTSADEQTVDPIPESSDEEPDVTFSVPTTTTPEYTLGSESQTTTTPVSELQPEVIEESDTSNSTTTVMKQVTSLFRLAVTTVTSALTATSSAPEIEEESIQTDETATTEVDTAEPSSTVEESSSDELSTTTEETSDSGTSTTEVATTSEEIEEQAVSTSTVENQSVVIEDTPDTTTTDVASSSDDVVEIESCTDDCYPYTISLNDFAFPLDEGVEITGAQLRMSFAGQKKATRERAPVFEVRYSDDRGVTWNDSGFVLVDEEASNSVNGGYYLFALSSISDQESLNALQVELTYRDDPRILEDLFVESVWLELFTLEPPEEESLTSFADLLADDGFSQDFLSGDTLVLPDGEVLEFYFTDDNEEENLIIKSNESTYNGLSEVTTYFSVTNTSNSVDKFAVQAYFPDQVGEVTALEVFNQNKPREVIIPEYRPYVYHCEAGWEYEGDFMPGSLEELSKGFFQLETAPETSTEIEEVTPATDDVVFDVPTTSLEITPVIEDLDETSPQTTTTVSQLVPTVMQLLQATVIKEIKVQDNKVVSTASSTDTVSEEELVAGYSCRNTNIVRECDELDGANTSCRVNQVKVKNHIVTQYAPGWDSLPIKKAALPAPSFFKRAAEFIGLAPKRKNVPDSFDVSAHTPEQYTVQPGETMYFKMDITFPIFTNGEYWIEAVGDRTYGLLDPFWSSQWRYRTPITIDNPTGNELSEQQVFLELDSSVSGLWANGQTDGDDIRFLRATIGNDAGWYSTSWSDRVAITIPASQVSENLTDFPVYVDLATLGADFFASVQTDGSDVRITDASATPNELPYQLVAIDTGAQTGELHFKASSLSSSTDNVFYLYYGNGSAIAYSATSTYGSENVWTNNFDLRYAMDDNPASNGLQFDDTSNANNAPARNGMTSGDVVAGQVGQALNHDGNDGGIFNTPLTYPGEFTASMWWRSDPGGNGFAVSVNAGSDEKIGPWTGGGGNNMFFRIICDACLGEVSDQTIAHPPDSVWNHVVITRDSSDKVDFYVNGGVPTRVFADAAQSGNSTWENFGGQTTQGFEGDMDELRFADVKRSDGWVTTEFNNQSNPAAFYSTTSESLSFTTFTELDHWVQHFDHAGEEADIWVQIDTIPDTATSTIYLYYGNATADSTSDEYAPFTYSTPQELYYVVNDDDTGAIAVYSLIDDNDVSIDGGAVVTLQSGETTSFATYASTSVISANGPITARTTNDGADNVVPISFATTTLVMPSVRGTETIYTYAPFTSATVEMFNGNDVTPVATGITPQNGTAAYTFNNNNATIVESDVPILGFARNGNNDGIAIYPPTTRDLFGFRSQQYWLSTDESGSNVDVFCSDGSTGTFTSIVRGAQTGNTICTAGGFGTGNAVRLSPTTAPIAAIQQADGNGGEATIFLPEPEFGTRYLVPQEADYISIACSPRFGTSTIEIQSAIGTVLDSGTCNAGGGLPGALNFTPGSPYSAGSQIVSTNNVPFYVYYEQASSNDETNTWSAVQAKKFNSLDVFSATFGVEEENEDAQYEQNNFRWYENNDTLTPDTAWDLGEEGLAIEGESITGSGAINPGDELRLRMNLVANNGTGTVDSVAFTLQYAEAETCSAVAGSSWFTVGDIGSTTAAFAGVGTPAIDGDTLPTLLLSDSTVAATFEEENVSRTIPNQVGNGEVVEFDWVVTPVTGVAVANEQYCFRMVRSTQQPLVTYTAYPQLLMAGPPEVPETIRRFDNERTASLQPTLEFSAVDQGGDALDYQVQISTDNTFGTTNVDRRSDVNFFDFESLTNPSDKSPFDNGSTIRFTPASALSNGVTYWWRVRAIDPDGSNTFGAWSTEQSFTIDTTVTVSEWFQTTDEQFDTNSLTSAITSGSGSIEPDIGGSNLIGEYGSVTLTDGATSSVVLNNSYTNPVVVGSLRYPRSITSPNQPAARVFNKTATGFDVKADNFSNDSVSVSTFDYIVMEAGDYLMDDGADGVRVFATSTAVSAIAGNGIPTDPGGLDIVYPTSFSAPPAVFTMVTTNNDPQWVVSSVYDGNNITNPPTATQVSVYLNDNLDANSHGSAEDIDVIALDVSSGENNSVLFDSFTTAADVTNTPNTKSFNQTFASTPGTILVQQLTMFGAQGGYAQIDTDTPPTASNVTVSIEEGGSGADRGHAAESVAIMAFASASGDILRASNATVISTPINFADADIGNAWGEVDWNDAGTVTYRVQYQTGGGFQNIPDSDLPGNNTGFTTGPINILSLDTSVYNQLRLTADLGGVNPEIFDWSVRWGQRVDVPELGDPFDNQKLPDTTPRFDFTASDPQGDDLEYEISISTDPTFAGSSTTINSFASSSDFANISEGGGGDTEPFNSGDQIAYTLPASLELTDGETYWWRVRAKDRNGSDAWSPWSVADNFTVDTTTVVSSWFQTTQAQFNEGEINGLVASSSDSVELGPGVGEYGTTTVTGNTWTTITTDLQYNEMVVIAKPSFVYDAGSDNHRVVQVRNKTNTSFEVKAENATLSLGGATNIDYLVMEAGDWVITDGAGGTRVLAGVASDVAEVEGSNTTYVGGRSVSFSPAFATAPVPLVTVSTANGSEWVTANVDDGTAGGNVTTAGMFVSLHISLDTDVTRVPEDIDYIVFEPVVGENNSTLFEAFNSPDSVTGNPTLVNFTQTFATAPGIILSDINGMDGGDGGISIEDETTPKTNTGATFTATEIPLNGAHTPEVVSVVAFETEAGILLRDSGSSGGLLGTIASEEIIFSDGVGPKFGQALIGATTPGNSTTSVQVQYQTATGSWALIPDTQIPGNSVGNATGAIDLTGVDIVAYPTIRLLATLQCDDAQCPSLDDWTIEWSEGVTMSGTLQEYDRTTNVNSGTVTVSVNGGVPVRTGTVTAGTWSIENVTAFDGDTVTVFVDGAADEQEAVSVFVYDGLGDMTGVTLYEQHLTIASDETAPVTIADLAVGDNSSIGTEDVFFNVTAGGELQVCAVGVCDTANLYIGSGNTFIPSASPAQSVVTHDLINDGTVELDANTVRVSGSWENNGTVTADTSTVIFTATSTAETISDAVGTSTFNVVTFGETTGTATWQLQDPLLATGNLAVNYGTLDRGALPINLSRALATGAAGFWTGVGTTTFIGGGSSAWSDANPVSQNVGHVVVDGAVRTVTVGSDVLAASIRIGANDTLNGGSNDIKVAGNFTNNNTFIPATSRLVVVDDSTDATITLGASNLYAFRASSTGGTVAFTEPTVTLLDNFEIATGTVNLPVTLLRVGGSFINTGGVFAHNNSEVQFTSNTTEAITLAGTEFLNAFYDVRFTGTGAWSFTDANATTSNTFLIDSGTVTLPTGQLSVARDFLTTAPGSFNANGGEVLFIARSTDPITTNGSPLNDVRVRAGSPVRGGDFDPTWLYRNSITIQASQIDDDLTDFPVYIDLADFGASLFSNINADGGDIRITESDGVTEVPREIVAVDTGAETGELYFKAPTLSSTTNSTFYIYYGNPLAVDYAITDTNGAENVWDDDFIAVYHMEELNAIDSTSFDRDATAVGSLTATSGRIGSAVDITDTAGDDYINLNSNLSELNGLTEMTISTWVNVDEDSSDDVLFATQSGTPILLWDNWSGNTDNDTYTFSVGSTGTGNRVDGAPTGVAVGDTWQYVTASMQGGVRNIYVDGALSNTRSGSDTTIPTNTGGSNIGRWQGLFDYGGLVDEFRISQVERSAEWIAAEYANMGDPSSFYTLSLGAGDPTRIFADATVTATGDVVLESATTQFPSTNFAIAGSFDNNAVFNAGSGAVTFTATTSGHTIAAGSSTFATLAINGVGGEWNIIENATATNAINLTAGNSLVVDSGITLESTGTFFNDMQNASTTWTGSTLRLSSGSDYTINNKTHGGDSYGTLQVTGDTDIKMWNSSSTVYNTLDTSSIYSQDHQTVDGDLYIFGDYNRSFGTEYWSYNTDFDGVDLASTSEERQVHVRVVNGGSVLIATSSIEILGSPSASTTIDAQSGSFALTTNNATVTAQYATFTGTDTTGLALAASSTVLALDNITFTIPTGASAVTVDASTIDTNPGSQFFNTDFISGSGNVNVTLSGSPTSFWWFRDGAGDRYGENFDNLDGDPGAVRWDDSNYQINISGVVYSDDGVTALGGPTCDGFTPNVRVVVDGGTYTDTAVCDGLTGAYNFSNVSYGGDPTIVVYLDTDGGTNGSVITRTPTADITDLDIYANRVITRHEDSAPLSIADMTLYDFDDDTDLRFIAATGTPDTLQVLPNTELLIASSTTFVPGGEITLQSSGSGTGFDGSLHIDDGATFVASGNETHTIGGSFFNDAGSTLSAASSTFFFTATTTGKGITQLSGDTLNFHELQFTGVGGGWNLTADIAVAADMVVATGTVTGTNDITLTNGELTGDGLLSLGGGTTTINTTNTLGGVQGWTFYDLVLGNGSTVGTTTRVDVATTTISNSLVISPAHFLDAGSAVFDLSGVGTVFTESGTLLPETSTFVYSGGGNVDVLSTTYYNLQFGGFAGVPVYEVGPSGVLVENDLLVSGAVPSTVDLNTTDPVVSVLGDVTILDAGNLSLSDTTIFTISGSYTNTATLTANGGELLFDSINPYTIAAGDSDFADVSLVGTGAVTITQNATSTGLFTIASTSDFTQQSGTTLAVGGQLSIESATTSWTDSTLSLYGGGDYTVNTKGIAENFATLMIGADTHIRTWDADAVIEMVDATGSWYSQDHATIDGDLYIYGAYVSDAGADHWSYATDFDGADLTGGAERQADVFIDDAASVAWTGGSISVLGTTTASTTIQNQGVGTYGVVIGGTTAANWRYATVRDTDAQGLTFTGSPNVSGFSHLDLLVQSNGGSAMTVGGSAITASPARTLTEIVFNSDVGVTGAINVTATGTTLSGWRFTAHSGNLDGEANDLDPAPGGGDPGYIIWDDSAAIISISGRVYEADGTTVSSVCDDSTTNIVLSIAGSLAQNASSSCASADGSYTISGVSFGSLDELMLYINDESPATGVTVTKDPISSIADADIYENHLIVRHENVTPLSIADLATWDSSDDADIPYTAITGTPDTLTLPANTKLLIWNNKEFAPGGNITLTGGGAGAGYDGSLEALAGSTFAAAGTESHTIGGSFEFAPSASFEAADSTITFTTIASGRSITVNNDAFANLSFTGAGSWTVTDPTLEVANDTTIAAGTLTLPVGTSTVGGSFTVTGGSFDANGGLLNFTAVDTGNQIAFAGFAAHDTLFSTAGTWVFIDTNASTTGSFTVATGTVTLPSGTLTVADDFVVTDTITHNSGTVLLSNTLGGNVVTLSNNDLYNLTISASGGDYTLTDFSAALIGDLIISAGSLTVASGTVSIGGSFDVSGGIFNNGLGTILLNSTDSGEIIDPGTNDLYNLVLAGVGGWILANSATTTNNFSLTAAGSFTATPGIRLYVGNVFTNTVGGASTTWLGTTLVLDGSNEYETNSKTTATELYDTLILGENTDISSWKSRATTLSVPTTSSWYSQNHDGIDGDLYIYGDYHIATTTEYWSAARDFDGALLGVPRQANVYIASSSIVTIEGGGLQIIGTASASTSIQNQGIDRFDFVATDGTLQANYYNVSDLTDAGLTLSGDITISSLSNGYFTQAENDVDLITLTSEVVNNNASLVITNTGFATGGFSGGSNVSLDATTTNNWSFTGSAGNLWGEAFDIEGGDVFETCSSIRWDDSSCLLTEQTEYRWRYNNGGLGVPDSEWFNTDWDKRTRVRIANNDNTTYADATVRVTLLYDADMRSDFADIRLTAADGVTPVDFWIERVDNSVEADVWVTVPSLPASETVSVFVYYGNAIATSLSSSTATMLAVDDFEDGNISEYTGQTSLFQVDAGSAYGGTLGLELNASNKGTRLNPGIARFDQTISTGETIRFMQYIDTTAGSSDEVCTLFGVQSPVTLNDNYGVCIEQFGVDRITLVRDAESTDTYGSVTVLASSTVSYTTGWYEVEIDWLTNNTINVSLYNPSGVQVATTTAVDATYSSGGYGFTSWGQNGGWDSFTSRTLLTSNPSIFFGVEQVRGGASYAAAQNQVTSAFTLGDTARLRVAIENTGLDITGQQFQIEYAAQGVAATCAAVPTVSYTLVPVSASCAGSAVCMATSTVIANGAATTDLLSVSRNTFSGGSFVEDPSNQTAATTVNQNFYTELEYALEITTNAVDQSYCFRVTNAGEAYDSYANIPKLSLAFDPTLDPVSLNGGLDISLTPGTTTTVIASTTVTDFNGFADLDVATTTFYKTSVGALCTPDNNNCYIASGSACTFTNCSGSSCTLSCSAEFQFHTDPTDDVGDPEEWFALMEVSDTAGGADLEGSIGVEVLTIRALEVLNAIGYGAVNVNENTGVFNPNVTLNNLGNETINVEIEGTDMTDGIASIIPASQQIFATSTFDYVACVSCNSLSVTPVSIDVDLSKPTTDSPPVSDDIYWGIEVPFGTASNAHSGSVTFTPVPNI